MNVPSHFDDNEDMSMESSVAVLKQQVKSLEGWKKAHDVQCNLTNKRLSRIELAMATALGGMIILGWFVNRVADRVIAMISNIQ